MRSESGVAAVVVSPLLSTILVPLQKRIIRSEQKRLGCC